MRSIKLRLLASETVHQRGTRKTTWLVHIEGRWKPLRDAPSVREETLSAPPGTVWERAYELEVAVGTWFTRVTTSPEPLQHRDPMRYLEREVRGTRQRVQRTTFIMTEHGLERRDPKISPP